MNIKVAFEKVLRIFENDRESASATFTMEVPVDGLSDGLYVLELISESVRVRNNVYIDFKNNRAINIGSHEDPLIEKNGIRYVFFQLSLEQIRSVLNVVAEVFEVRILSGNNVFYRSEIAFNSFDLDSLLKTNRLLLISDFCVKTEKSCELTVHKSNRAGVYSESVVSLRSGDSFEFKEFLVDNVYVGVQGTYQCEDIEVEEKIIVIGQKGMVETGVLSVDGTEFVPLLPFARKYQTLYTDDGVLAKSTAFQTKGIVGWSEVKSVDEILSSLKSKKIEFYEMDANFLIDSYVNKLTYSNQRMFAYGQNVKKSHVLLGVCSECKNKTKCMQAIPSGLSYSVFKMCVGISNQADCEIFKTLEEIK